VSANTPHEVERLLSELRSKEPYRRNTAVRSFVELRITDPRVVEALRALAGNDPDRYVADEAKAALRKLVPQHNSMPVEQTAHASGDAISGRANPTETELLMQLVSLQQEQNASLGAIRKHTGCTYAYLLFTVVIAILAFLFMLLSGGLFL